MRLIEASPAIHNQRDRRNLTDSELLRLVALVDGRKSKGGDYGNQYTKEANINSNISHEEPSHLQTARTVGISPSKVQQARKVMDDPERREEVERKRKTPPTDRAGRYGKTPSIVIE